MAEGNSDFKDINSKYKHYQLFKKVVKYQRFKLSDMIFLNGSRQICESAYFKSMKQKNLQLLKSFLTKMLGSTALIFFSTLILHRKRSWILSTASTTRSLLFKYVPFWAYFCYKPFEVDISQPPYKIEGDFGEIQEQFFNLYLADKGNVLSSMKKRQKKGNDYF